MFTADASVMKSSFFTGQGYLKGTRDTGDLSYRRPLTLEQTGSRWSSTTQADSR